MNYFISNDGELYHYGVTGMKWGIIKRKNNSSTKKKNNISEDAKIANELKKKKTRQMSNAELRKLNERIQLEQSYSRLKPNAVKRGLNFVTSTAAVMGTAMSLYNNSNSIVSLGKKVGNKVVDLLGDLVVKDIQRHL